MDDDTVTLNLVMVNINAICNVLFLIYIPIVNEAFTVSVEESNAKECSGEHIRASFSILLSANCFGSNLHPQLLRFPWKGCL